MPFEAVFGHHLRQLLLAIHTQFVQNRRQFAYALRAGVVDRNAVDDRHLELRIWQQVAPQHVEAPAGYALAKGRAEPLQRRAREDGAHDLDEIRVTQQAILLVAGDLVIDMALDGGLGEIEAMFPAEGKQHCQSIADARRSSQAKAT